MPGLYIRTYRTMAKRTTAQDFDIEIPTRAVVYLFTKNPVRDSSGTASQLFRYQLFPR
jgi:hypothetical protein